MKHPNPITTQRTPNTSYSGPRKVRPDKSRQDMRDRQPAPSLGQQRISRSGANLRSSFASPAATAEVPCIKSSKLDTMPYKFLFHSGFIWIVHKVLYDPLTPVLGGSVLTQHFVII